MAKKPIRKTMRRRVSDPPRSGIKRTRMAEGNRSAIIEARIQQALHELPSHVQEYIQALLTNSCLLFIRNAGARYGDHADSATARALIAAGWALMAEQAMTATLARIEQKAAGK